MSRIVALLLALGCVGPAFGDEQVYRRSVDVASAALNAAPFTLCSLWMNAVASAATIGGAKLPPRPFTVTHVYTYVSGVASGAGNTVLRVTDGTNNCDATFSCTTSTNTTGPKYMATTGTCSFAANSALTVKVQTAGCATTQPTLKNIDVVGNWR